MKRTSEPYGEIRCIARAVSIGTFVLEHIEVEKRRVVTRGAMYRCQHLSRRVSARKREQYARTVHVWIEIHDNSLPRKCRFHRFPTRLGANESRCLLIAAVVLRTERIDEIEKIDAEKVRMWPREINSILILICNYHMTMWLNYR